MKRADEINDLLLVIDNKENALQMTEDRISHKVDNLCEIMKEVKNEINKRNKDRSGEIANPVAERQELDTTLAYVEELRGDQMVYFD